MPTTLPIEGSSPRDFCMLERNFLSHARLALLLALFASAVLLEVRLPLNSSDDEENRSDGNWTDVVVLASVGIGAAVLVILAGYGEYELGFRDIRSQHPTLQSSKPHLFLMCIIVIIVVVTCVLLLLFNGEVGLPTK
ncbi:hypothetical protein PENSPDRAFT_194951 [Peniophora sp. CONT]|nr:hypothetical protein PENSPDRAFT_194951 [Peniophora sp. CONT]